MWRTCYQRAEGEPIGGGPRRFALGDARHPVEKVGDSPTHDLEVTWTVKLRDLPTRPQHIAARIGRVSALSLWCTLALLVSGCGQASPDLGESVGGTPAEAAAIVERWFVLARSGEADGGWSLLYPSVRADVIGSADVYHHALEDADWRGFDYDVGEARLTDGDYRVDVRVLGGEASLPAFMRDWGFMQFPTIDGEPSDTGIIIVRIPPFGPERGIQLSG